MGTRRRRPRAVEADRSGTRGVPYLCVLLLTAALVLSIVAVPGVMRAIMPQEATWAAITWTARSASVLIRAAGIRCVLTDGNRLQLTNHVFRIDAACTGGLWLAAYTVAVVLMPVPARRKAQGLLVGLPALTAFNLVRLVVAAAASEWRPEWFYVVHDVVMQRAFAGVVLLVWCVWLRVSIDELAPGWA